VLGWALWGVLGGVFFFVCWLSGVGVLGGCGDFLGVGGGGVCWFWGRAGGRDLLHGRGWGFLGPRGFWAVCGWGGGWGVLGGGVFCGGAVWFGGRRVGGVGCGGGLGGGSYLGCVGVWGAWGGGGVVGGLWGVGW